MGFIIRAVAVSGVIGLIAVSSVINFTFGTKLGQGYEGLIYGLAFLCGDFTKAYLPIVMEAAIQDKSRTKATVCLVIFVFLVMASIVAGIGLSATIRSEGAGDVRAAQAEYKRLVGDKESVDKELRSLGAVRPVGTIEADISAKKLDRLYDRSKQCKDATALDSRALCQEIERLEGELATSKRADGLRKRLQAFSDALTKVDTKTAMKVADPQAAALSRLTGYPEADVEIGLSILGAGIVELVSSLGLWLLGVKLTFALPSLKMSQRKPRAKASISAPAPIAEGDCSVKLWADAHLAVRSDSKILTRDVIDSFSAWCRLNDKDKVHANVLGRKLTDLGYMRKKIGGQAYYLGVAFKREKPELRAVI